MKKIYELVLGVVRKPFFIFFVISLHAIIIFTPVAIAENVKRTGISMRVPAQAFDPIDPLRGHYLMFQASVRAVKPPEICKGECSEGYPFSAWLVPDEEGNAKISWSEPQEEGIQAFGQPDWRMTGLDEIPSAWMYVIPFNRYYVSEENIEDLEKKLREAPSDKAFVTLKVKGKRAIVTSFDILE
jgi:hypothetical protein